MIVLALALAAGAWTPWAPRPEIAPKTIEHGNVLEISGAGNPAIHGGWHRKLDGIEPGKWYRLEALYQTDGVKWEHLQVTARLEWLAADGKRAGEPDYAWQTQAAGDWKRVSLDVPAPEKASSVLIQLHLSNAAAGTVRWKDVRLEPSKDPGPRKVRVASVNLRPRNTGSREASVQAFLALTDDRVKQADVILLPEGITVVGTDKSYAEVAEPLPGPTTAALGKLAARHHSWVVAGLYEKEGSVIYNTAVLLDREGRLAGKYRKVYLPREEIDGGITPGSEYPAFRTDFGTIGLMICWDSNYADPARGLTLNGAELVLVPIWGGNETLMRARAIENRVFIATSGYDYPTHIIDPDGKFIAAAAHGEVAFADIDLNRRYLDPWLGDMSQRLRKELRLDVPIAVK